MRYNPSLAQLIEKPYVRDDVIVSAVGGSKNSIRKVLKDKGAKHYKWGWLSTDVIRVLDLQPYITMMVKIDAQMESERRK